MSQEIEEGTELSLDFGKIIDIGKSGLAVIPAVAQEKKTGKVLMLGYVNREALEYSQKNRVAAFWSTSRNELWVKGKTSGEYLDIINIYVNCEQNSILYEVSLRGSGACHTKNKDGSPRHSCYYRFLKNTELRFT